MRSFSPRLRASAALLVATAGVTALGALGTSAYAATPADNARAESLAQSAYSQTNSNTGSSTTTSHTSTSNTSTPAPSTTPTGSAQSIAAQIVPADQLAAFDQIISHESGWNVTATNPTSGAYGLAQSLPGNKMASAGADWQTNASTQITWALNYMNTTYGSPTQAWSFWQNNSWY